MISLKNIVAKFFAFVVVSNIKRSYGRAAKIQAKTLNSLLKIAKKTKFGLDHSFDKSIAWRIMHKKSLLGIMKELRNTLMK